MRRRHLQQIGKGFVELDPYEMNEGAREIKKVSDQSETLFEIGKDTQDQEESYFKRKFH